MVMRRISKLYKDIKNQRKHKPIQGKSQKSDYSINPQHDNNTVDYIATQIHARKNQP